MPNNNFDFLRPVLGDDLFAQFTEKMAGATGLTLVNIADGSYIPKAKYDTEREKVRTLTQNNTDLTNQLAEAKKNAPDVAALNQQIEQLTKDVSERDGRLAAIAMDGKLLALARAAGAKNPEMVIKLLDRSQIKEKEDGALEGVNEQFESQKKSDPYLYDGLPSARGGFGGGQDVGTNNLNDSMNSALRTAFGRG